MRICSCYKKHYKGAPINAWPRVMQFESYADGYAYYAMFIQHGKQHGLLCMYNDQLLRHAKLAFLQYKAHEWPVLEL